MNSQDKFQAKVLGKSYALRLLKTRLRSERELWQALQKKGLEAEDIREIIDELKEVKLIDDYRYALAWMHTRDRLAPKGENVLKQELLQKGIDPEIISKAKLERQEEDDYQDELERARRLVEIKDKTYGGLPREVRYRRLAAYLERRGFSFETIRRILNT